MSNTQKGQFWSRRPQLGTAGNRLAQSHGTTTKYPTCAAVWSPGLSPRALLIQSADRLGGFSCKLAYTSRAWGRIRPHDLGVTAADDRCDMPYVANSLPRRSRRRGLTSQSYPRSSNRRAPARFRRFRSFIRTICETSAFSFAHLAPHSPSLPMSTHYNPIFIDATPTLHEDDLRPPTHRARLRHEISGFLVGKLRE